MADRQFKPDLTGSDETLEHLLARLRSTLRRPARPRRDGPTDWDHFVTSRRPHGGLGGAEAPIPRERPIPDAYAAF
ncbi:hypothetical protein [Phenylobacterium sp.]|uniref:hypothetical protein n=1 Tax=Phenylobacterium sp. TaxID=1871053 RepID=UPI002B8A43AB|nr:hypothetical protein [Phenylobacterium sp.]HLZ73995.1 hypothetical protein [Phenylobacterium sp.]